jgi:hypothetical protein
MAKNKSEPSRARWDGQNEYLLEPLRRADGTLSTELFYGTEWVLSEIPSDLLVNPNMVVLTNGSSEPITGGDS